MTLASIHGKDPVKTAEGILIIPDAALTDIVDRDAFDAIVVPGGIVGSPNMASDKLVGEVLRNHFSKRKLTAAICMGVAVLLAHGIGYGKNITSYPTCKERLAKEYNFIEKMVIQDGNLITGRGPGAVWYFTLKVVEYLVGSEKAKLLADINILTEYLT